MRTNIFRQNHHFHIDHVFPYSRFTKPKLKKAGVADEDVDDFKEMTNCLPNLQLLEGAENTEKQASLPAEWMADNLPKSARTNYCDIHLLGTVPESLTDFRDFYDARRTVIRSRVVTILAAKSDETATAPEST